MRGWTTSLRAACWVRRLSGAYALAWNLANVPLEKVTSLVTTIIPSYFAAVQTEPAELRRYLRTLTEALAVATFPATIGLALIARELVPLAMGQKWEAVIAPLEVLSVYVAFRSVVALLPKVLTAVGNARFVMWNDLVALVILPTAFYIGSHWGIRGNRLGLGRRLPVRGGASLLEDVQSDFHALRRLSPRPSSGLQLHAGDGHRGWPGKVGDTQPRVVAAAA